jgi:hypothetical protein
MYVFLQVKMTRSLAGKLARLCCGASSYATAAAI